MTTIRQINAELVKSGKAQNYIFRDQAIMAGVNVDSETESAAYLGRKMAYMNSLIAQADTQEKFRASLKEHRATMKWLKMACPAEMDAWNDAAVAKFGPKGK